MTSRPSARWLAPLALLASLVAVLVLVSSTLGGGDGGDASPATEPAAEQTRTEAEGGRTSTTEASAEESGPATYRVQPGDNLGAIAEETGVSVERLQELNPNVDPQALSVGQTLRLRGGG